METDKNLNDSDIIPKIMLSHMKKYWGVKKFKINGRAAYFGIGLNLDTWANETYFWVSFLKWKIEIGRFVKFEVD